MRDKTKTERVNQRYEVAIDSAKTLEDMLGILCECAENPDVPRERISRLLGIAYDLTDPLIASIHSWAEDMGVAV